MNILLIGDIMLDINYYMNSDRMCPEDNTIPICNNEIHDFRAGGSANVAINLVKLGHKVNLISYMGNDNEGNILEHKLLKAKVNTRFLIKCSKPTITKTRYFLKNKLKFRYDIEEISTINSKITKVIKLYIKEILKKHVDIIVISDYNKGLLNSEIIQYLKNIANTKIIVDPKPENINLFNDIYLLKPNLDELSKIYNEQVTLDNIFEVSYYISKKYNIKFIVTSLGKEGIYLYDKDKNIGEIFSKSYIQQDEVVDVTGAGDIVLAIIANNINNLKEGIVLANKIAQESVKYIGVNI